MVRQGRIAAEGTDARNQDTSGLQVTSEMGGIIQYKGGGPFGMNTYSGEDGRLKVGAPPVMDNKSLLLSGSGTASQKQAALTRAKWEEFKRVYRPQEEKFLNELMSTGRSSALGDVAGGLANNAYSNQATQFQRNLSRQGGKLTAEEQKGYERRRSMDRSATVASAENVTRRTLKDENTQLLSQAVMAGRGIQNSASRGLGTAAGLEAQREAQNAANKAAADAQNMQTAGMIASMVIAFA